MNDGITCVFRDVLYDSPEISVTDGITCVFRDGLYGSPEISVTDGMTCVFRDGLYGGLIPADLIPVSTMLASFVSVTLPAAASKNTVYTITRIVQYSITK